MSGAGPSPGANELSRQRQSQAEAKCQERRDHQVVRNGEPNAAQLGQESKNVMSEVVIVDALTGKPHVLRWHGKGSRYRRGESIIHELLETADVRKDTSYVGPENEKREEKALLAHDRYLVLGQRTWPSPNGAFGSRRPPRREKRPRLRPPNATRAEASPRRRTRTDRRPYPRRSLSRTDSPDRESPPEWCGSPETPPFRSGKG